MKNNEKTKRKSHNRVQKDQRDFDTLFNAEIDIKARERRQERRKKRKKSKLNRMFAAIVRASRFCFSKSVPQVEEAAKDQNAAILPPARTTKRIESPAPTLAVDQPVAAVSPDEPRPVPSTVTVMAEQKSKKKKRNRKRRKSFFVRAMEPIRRFYAEFTDKALIAKLREEPENSFDIFADIKESLENTSIDAIIAPSHPETVDETEQAQLQLEIVEEKVQYTAIPVEEEPVISEMLMSPEEQPADEEEDLSSDEISAVVEIMFNGTQLDGQQQIDEYEQALIPEVVEAMKEVDYEHIMGILEPKLALTVDRVDRFLDHVSETSKMRASSAGEWILKRVRRVFRDQNEKPTVFITVLRKIKKTALSGYSKAVLPCMTRLKKGTGFLIGSAQKSIGAVDSKLKGRISLLVQKAHRPEGEQKSSRLGVMIATVRTQLSQERSLSIVACTSILVVGVFFGRAVYLEHISAFEVYFLNSQIGIVKEKSDVLDILPMIEENLEKETGADIYINADEDFTFKMIRSKDLTLLTGEQIQDKLEDINKINIAAYALKINGDTIAILMQKEQLESILANIKEEYMADKDESDFESIDFGENVEIVPVQAKMMQIRDADEIEKYLTMGTTEEKVHLIAEGETLSGIAQKYGIKTADVIAANPGVDPTKLQINQKISLIAPKPFITVQTKEIHTYIAQVPFDIVYEDSQNLFKGETTVKSAGKAGEREVTAEIMKQNGVEVARVELESTVLKEPVSQVVIKGAKPLPLLLGTGKLQNPVRGTLSSRYGQRWSKMHQGIDISAAKGTKINAADGGTVIYAGYDGSYGNTVRINHGANKVTVYAHCSTILVKQGQKVAKGQQIATVGTTGRTTGPHLHFEVRINEKAVNPLEHVKY